MHTMVMSVFNLNCPYNEKIDRFWKPNLLKILYFLPVQETAEVKSNRDS